MRLFVGLGNPGPKYARNRHNIGYMAVDRIAADHGAAPWRNKFQGLVTEAHLGSEKTVLLKPETFMNLSGQSVGAALRFYKLAPEDVVVFHDELDLAPGKCRVKQGGGHAGHNGLRSVHGHIGESYARVRLGIGHPGRKELVSAYVLHDFARADSDWLDDLMRGISDGAAALAGGDHAGFMNAVALRTAPPRSSATVARANDSASARKHDAPDGAPDRQKRKPDRSSGLSPDMRSRPETPPRDTTASGAAPTGAPAPGNREYNPDDTRSLLQRLADKFR